MKAMFTLTVFEILLFEARSALLPAQRGTRSERIKGGKDYLLRTSTTVGSKINLHSYQHKYGIKN